MASGYRRKKRPPKKSLKGQVWRNHEKIHRTAVVGGYPCSIGKREPVTYIVEAEGTNRVKIGQTNQLPQRFGALKAGSGANIRLVRVIKGTYHEKILHRNLAQFRTHGEWFNKTPELVSYIDRYHRSDPYFYPMM